MQQVFSIFFILYFFFLNKSTLHKRKKYWLLTWLKFSRMLRATLCPFPNTSMFQSSSGYGTFDILFFII